MTSMTTISSTDFNYDTVEYTIGMASGRFFTCSKTEDFEQRAVKDPLFEKIPDDKPVVLPYLRVRSRPFWLFMRAVQLFACLLDIIFTHITLCN